MLATKRSPGVVPPEVNLRNALYADKVFTLTLSADITRSPKQGYQWPHKKDLSPQTFFKKFHNVVIAQIVRIHGLTTDEKYGAQKAQDLATGKLENLFHFLPKVNVVP